MKHFLILSFSVMLLLISCRKDDTCNGNSIKQAIIEDNKELMRGEINKLCAGIEVVRTTNDPDGLTNSLDKLVAKINTFGNVKAEILCYYCIQTLPEQSEIKVTVNSTSRVLDISYSADKKLLFVNMH
jgi:hypothetical protein